MIYIIYIYHIRVVITQHFSTNLEEKSALRRYHQSRRHVFDPDVLVNWLSLKRQPFITNPLITTRYPPPPTSTATASRGTLWPRSRPEHLGRTPEFSERAILSAPIASDSGEKDRAVWGWRNLGGCQRNMDAVAIAILHVIFSSKTDARHFIYRRFGSVWSLSSLPDLRVNETAERTLRNIVLN